MDDRPDRDTRKSIGIEMSVDLRSNSTFERVSLVLMDDCLVKLEHGWTEDRIKRFMYEAVEKLVITRRLPWPHMIICAVVLMGPGVFLLFSSEAGLPILGGGLIAVGLILVLWYAYCGKTTIRIDRAGKTAEIKGIFRPGRINRFAQRFITNVRVSQHSAAERRRTDPSRAPQDVPLPIPSIPVEIPVASPLEDAPFPPGESASPLE